MSVHINASNSVFIITECDNSVNTQNTELKTNQKWVEKKQKNAIIAQKMRKIGYMKRGERMSQCGDVLDYRYCSDCGTWYIKKANLCRDRFCPVCSWRLSLQRYNEMREVISIINSTDNEITNWSLITLTCKNCDEGQVSETLSLMAKAWNLTKQQRDIKPHIVGWARSVEITYNEESKTFHPHYHCLIAWKNGNSGTLLVNKWLFACKKYKLTANVKAQNVSPVQHLRTKNVSQVEVSQELPEQFTKAILETFKYSIKTSDLEDMPLKAFKNLVEQYGGKRLIAYGGIIKDVARAKKALEDDIIDDIQIDTCKNCGSNELEQLLYKWSFGTKAYERIGIDND